MKLQKRAYLAITRRKKSSVLLFLIFFFLSLTLLLGATLLGSITSASADLRQTLCSSFSIKIDQSTIETYSKPRTPPERGKSSFIYTGERITSDVVKTIASTEGIEEYDAEYQLFLYADELKLFPGMYKSFSQDADFTENWDEIKRKSMIASTRVSAYYVHLNTEMASDFRTGALSLVEGRHITPDDRRVALISDALAEKNGVKLGDTLHVHWDDDFLDGAWSASNGYAEELTVVGIFHVNQQQIITPRHTSEDQIANNWVFVDETTAYEFEAYADSPLNFYEATFFVNDPAELDAVIDRAKARDDVSWQYFTIFYDNERFDAANEPLQKLKWIITVAAAVLLVVMLILLYQILQLSLQGRKREFKVYRTLGIKKASIFTQLLLECVLMMALAFVPAATVTAVSADSIGNALLSTQQAEPEERRAPTDAEIQAVIQGGGNLQEFLEEVHSIDVDSAPAELEIQFSPLVALGVLVGLLTAVCVFLWLQIRYMPVFYDPF